MINIRSRDRLGEKQSKIIKAGSCTKSLTAYSLLNTLSQGDSNSHSINFIILKGDEELFPTK